MVAIDNLRQTSKFNLSWRSFIQILLLWPFNFCFLFFYNLWRQCDARRNTSFETGRSVLIWRWLERVGRCLQFFHIIGPKNFYIINILKFFLFLFFDLHFFNGCRICALSFNNFWLLCKSIHEVFLGLIIIIVLFFMHFLQKLILEIRNLLIAIVFIWLIVIMHLL